MIEQPDTAEATETVATATETAPPQRSVVDKAMHCTKELVDKALSLVAGGGPNKSA